MNAQEEERNESGRSQERYENQDNENEQENSGTTNRNRVSMNEILFINCRTKKNRNQDEKRNKFFLLYQELNPNAPVFQPIDDESRRRSYEPDEKRQRSFEQEEIEVETNAFLESMLTNFEILANEARIERERQAEEFDERIKRQQQLIRQRMAKLVVSSAARTNTQTILTGNVPMSNRSRIVITEALSDDTPKHIERVNPFHESELSIFERDTINKNRKTGSQDKYEQESALEKLRRRAREEEQRRDEQDRRRQDEEDRRQRKETIISGKTLRMNEEERTTTKYRQKLRINLF